MGAQAPKQGTPTVPRAQPDPLPSARGQLSPPAAPARLRSRPLGRHRRALIAGAPGARRGLRGHHRCARVGWPRRSAEGFRTRAGGRRRRLQSR
eukprot:5292944-Alexandrium_andersonii.AAC.1